MSEDLARAGAVLLGAGMLGCSPLPGGCLSQIVHVRLDDGRDVVVKDGRNARREAAMLTAIAQSGAPVPAVLAFDDALLVIAYLRATGSVSGAWSSLGMALSRLHAVTGSAYGWPDDLAFGEISIRSTWSDDWPDFWASNRLRNNVPHLPVDLARRVELLADDLANRLPARPRPALLHGDLWGGNVLASGDQVVGFIDPACYFGHAEVDFAMLDMFDSPSVALRQAYGPSEPGFRERSPIYRLWPALMHYRLFGSGYRPTVEACLSEARV